MLEIKRTLSRGLLPPDYYIMAEQQGGDLGAPDVLTLQTPGGPRRPDDPLTGTVTLTETPPAVNSRTTITRDPYARLRRTLVVRHISGDRIVATVEVISPGNKLSRHALRSFIIKAVAALDSGVHLLLIDIHPPGPGEPHGIHGALLNDIATEEYTLHGDRRLTAAAYVGGVVIEAFVEHFAVGEPIPTMPLFLTSENYVRVPLEAAYLAAWEDVPSRYREALTTSP